LETEVEALIARKAQVPETEYYDQLEKLMRALSEFYP